MENIMEIITQYNVPVIVGICLCVGYVIKNVIPTDKINRFIPMIMAALGLMLNIWMTLTVTPEIILGGMFSGLASTGLYEAFRNLIKKEE